VAVVLLVGSRSETAIATAVIAGVLAIAIATVGVLRQRGVDAQVVAGGAGLAAVAVAAGSWRLFWRISELLSGDDTFGGRRRIWNTVVGVAGLRPWRGWGYWAYWNVTNSGAIIRYGSAHNSLLEVYLGLGRIGLLVFSAIVVLAIAGVSRRLWLCYTPSTVWLAITVGTLLVGNITESFVLFHSHNWALVCGAAVGCWTWRNRDQSS
jgi:O-antigen ligase